MTPNQRGVALAGVKRPPHPYSPGRLPPPTNPEDDTLPRPTLSYWQALANLTNARAGLAEDPSRRRQFEEARSAALLQRIAHGQQVRAAFGIPYLPPAGAP